MRHGVQNSNCSTSRSGSSSSGSGWSKMGSGRAWQQQRKQWRRHSQVVGGCAWMGQGLAGLAPGGIAPWHMHVHVSVCMGICMGMPMCIFRGMCMCMDEGGVLGVCTRGHGHGLL